MHFDSLLNYLCLKFHHTHNQPYHIVYLTFTKFALKISHTYPTNLYDSKRLCWIINLFAKEQGGLGLIHANNSAMALRVHEVASSVVVSSGAQFIYQPYCRYKNSGGHHCLLHQPIQKLT